MKTLVNIATFVLLFTLFNCNPDTEKITPEIEFGKQIKFFTTITFRNQPTVLNDEFSKEKVKIHYASKGVSYAKKLTKYEFEMSHIATQLLYSESIRIEDGDFIIQGEEGHSLFGTYEGYGNSSQNNLDLLLSISGGTGYYKNATGYFEMKTEVHEPHSSSLFFKVNGYIVRDK